MALISPASDGVIATTDELLEASIINNAAFVTVDCAGGGDASVQIMRPKSCKDDSWRLH